MAAEAPTSALIDERLLRLFDTLYTTRSVSAAAALLGHAQPTVSIWLGQLRRELGDPLFVRTAEGMVPTPRADALIGTARAVIEGLRSLTDRQRPFDPDADSRIFRICMTDASHVTLLPALLGHVRQTAPNARIEALQIDGLTAGRLRSGEADLALGSLPELETAFYQQVLFTQDWVCLASPNHPRLKGRITRADYRREPHVAITGGTGHQLLQSAMVRDGIERRVVLQLPGFLGLSGIISGSDLVATLPRHTAETLADVAGLVVHECPVAIPTFAVKQHWHARYHHDAASRWLRGTCAALFQRAAPSRTRSRPKQEE